MLGHVWIISVYAAANNEDGGSEKGHNLLWFLSLKVSAFLNVIR